MTKKEIKKMSIYYEGLMKVNDEDINKYLNKININDLLLLKYFIEHKKCESTTNNVMRLEFYATSIKNNIQSRMVNNGASRD